MNAETFTKLATLFLKWSGLAGLLGAIAYVARKLVEHGEIRAEKKFSDLENKAFITAKKEAEKFDSLPADERRKLFVSKLVRKNDKQ